MPSTEIRIEHVNDRWVADVEVGGMVARRRSINAGNFESIMRGVVDAYLELVPHEEPRRDPIPEPPAPEPTEKPEVKSRATIAAQRGIGSEVRWRGARRS